MSKFIIISLKANYKMQIKLPHTITNPQGERITFKEIIKDDKGDKVLLSASCAPGAGPEMHVHFKQAESLTVEKGKLTYQIMGQEPVEIGAGQTIFFDKKVPHKFWNASNQEVVCSGWVQPVNSIVFFLSTLYNAQKVSGSERPEAFDAAYLLVRYKNEYDMPQMPGFVKKVIMPITYTIGKLTGKYKKFANAPTPLD